MATLREALTNVGRHSEASRASVVVTVDADMCRLQVLDNGKGIDHSQSNTGGNGRINMRNRAEKLHGTCDIETPKTGGPMSDLAGARFAGRSTVIGYVTRLRQ